jgi:carboxyl-terminal processing protease
MPLRSFIIFLFFILVAGCGGGDGSQSTGNANQEAEKAWVRSYLDDRYLWYDEIVDVPQENYPLATDYFHALLVKSRDRFSFTIPVAKAQSLMQEGQDVGFGVKWGWVNGSRLFAFYVDPNSPAAASITRGTELTSVNGRSIPAMTLSELNSVLLPATAGVPVGFTVSQPNTTSTTVSLTSSSFSITTVEPPRIITLPGVGKVGYLLFNDHLKISEHQLINAMTYFQQQGVNELVLDLRYNTGGYLDIAEEVASMIGGSAVQGKVFEKLLFNSKHQGDTSDPANTFFFSNLDLSGNLLPELGLARLFVLTGSATCSASESIINGLLPHIDLVRIGWTTCGKPYAFRQANFDQNAYFAIQLEGVNSAGTNNFKSGFAPTCQVSDDIGNALGNASEARLKAALYYMQNGVCPVGTTFPSQKQTVGKELVGRSDQLLLGQRPGVKIVE